jgi:hypothetical protein
MYAQVTIGRNVPATSDLAPRGWPGEATGYTPMRRSAWEEFQREAGDIAAAAVGVDRVELHFGTGEWNGEPEESVIVSAYSDVTDELWTWENFRRDVVALAREYGQDAIYVILDGGDGEVRAEMVRA